MISDWFLIHLFSLLQFSLCSSILLPSSVSILLAINLNFLSGKLITSIFSYSFIWNIFLYLFILLDFLCLFTWIRQNSSLPQSWRNNICVDYMSWVVWIGQLKWICAMPKVPWESGWLVLKQIRAVAAWGTGLQGCPAIAADSAWGSLGFEALGAIWEVGWLGLQWYWLSSLREWLLWEAEVFQGTWPWVCPGGLLARAIASAGWGGPGTCCVDLSDWLEHLYQILPPLLTREWI